MSKESAIIRYQKKRFFGSSHFWALEGIKNLVKEGEVTPSDRVLDVGSGSGLIGEELHAAGFSQVDAVEPDQEARETTSQNYNIIVPTFEALPLHKYKVVFLLDVLEHMVAPEEFLQTLTSRLEPKAILFISVPNIAHWSIRLSLLAGYFEYHRRGILDYTHYRFFTRRSLDRLLKNTFAPIIRSSSGSIVPLELLVPRWCSRTILFTLLAIARAECARRFQGLCAYQLLRCIQLQ